MKKIDSFTINHLVLMPGVYLSRRDVTPAGDVISTYDIRMTAPNRQPAIDPRALHAIEHLAATWLRNNPDWAGKTVYWGPMGCCTGNYFIVQGEHQPAEIARLMHTMFSWIAQYDGPIPGATARDCGNHTFNDLDGARKAAARYAAVLDGITPDRLTYPQ